MEEMDNLFLFIMLVQPLHGIWSESWNNWPQLFLVRSLFFDKRNYYVTIILRTTLVSARMKIITNVSALTGQRNREVAKTWSYRRMCNKPEPKVESPPPTVSEHRTLVFEYRQHYIFLNQGCKAICSFPSCSYCPAPRASFKVPGYRPSEMDRKILLWSGRYKTADQIPEFVS